MFISVASSNEIGGTAPGAANTISGNEGHGVVIVGAGATGNKVLGNFIGTDATGTADLGNTDSGVLINDAPSNEIGGTAPGAANTIAFNGGVGVTVIETVGASTGNAILSNSIFQNTDLGIDLDGDGVTDNDTDDADASPNKLQNWPVISNVIDNGGGSYDVTYLVDTATANATYPLRVEFFIADADEQEGRTFIDDDSYSAADFAAGDKTITLTFGTPSDALVATATDADGNTSEFSAPIVIFREVDLAVTKTTANPTPDYLTEVDFIVTVTNLGPTVPASATVVDLLPAGLAYVSHTADQGSYDPATGTWNTNAIPLGATATLTITARVETVVPVINTAAINTASLPDPDDTKNSASATITPVASDLAITKSLADFFGDADTNIITATFKLTVTNHGPSDATGVTVDDPLPEGATLVSASAPYDPDTGIWTIGALANGASAILATVLTADAEHNLINIAVVSGDQPDQDLSNNLSGTQAQHDGPNLDEFVADLSLTKTVDNETPAAGGLIIYTLEVTNRGPSATAGVVVLDTLSAGLAFVSAETTSRAGRCLKCGYNDSLGVWIVGHLALGATATLKITVRVLGTGEIVNTAEIVENHLPDRNGDNDIASATITVSSSTQAKATATEDEAGVPEVFALRQNYPNPFNPSTEIRFDLPEAAYVRLVVYDAMGREVARLVDGSMGAGRHAVRWEAGGLPSGAYLYRITAGAFSEARMMILLR